MGNRAFSLDALRGYAILTMILSGTIASGILPGWMYHAQLPPPSNVFNPDVYGITWVDLVFPFFLFAMGAAFPFSIGKKLAKGESKLMLCWSSVVRGLKLAFFAIFLQHIYPWVIASPQDVHAWVITLTGFVLLFPMFMRMPWQMPKWVHYVIEYGAYLLALLLMTQITYANGRVFSLSFSNIIILVLANMAIFGSIIYVLTPKKPLIRLAILPFVMAVLLGSQTDGSWQQWLFQYSPVPWLYKFLYLKYLFIVLPGTIAGEYLLEWVNTDKSKEVKGRAKQQVPLILLLSIGLAVFNLYGLYMRELVLNILGSIVLLGVLGFLLRGDDSNSVYWRKLFRAGTYLLLLGLFFEAFEGGIRKDHSTYSYYFVTSGLAFIQMISFSILCDVYRVAWLKPLQMAGQNPMIAYVATNVAIMPLLHLLGLADWLNYLGGTPFLGFMRGVVLTSLAILLAGFFTRIKWFWRT